MGSKRILIVEDDVNLSVSMSRAIRQVSPSTMIEWVVSVEQALERIEVHKKVEGSIPFDLVITDFFTPGRADGLELATFLIQSGTQVPVIVMSSLEGEFRARAKNPTFDSVLFLAKPFKADDFKKIIEPFLK